MTAYCLITDVEGFMQLNFTSGSTPTDDEVTGFISIADGLIDDHTQRKWSEETVTDEYYDADGDKNIILNNGPITEITSVYENVASLTETPSWVERTEGHANDFLVYNDENRLRFHNNIPAKGYQNLKISYKYGYTTTPTSIKYASILLTTIMVIKAITNPEILDNLRGYSLLDLKVFKYGQSPKIQAYVNEYNDIIEEYGKKKGAVVGFG